MNYGKRLLEAMVLAGFTRAMLAAAIGKSVQSVGQCITSNTNSFTAENSAKAALALQVDHFWLATGQGKPRPDRAWPFTTFTPSQYYKLSASFREEIEERVLGKITKETLDSQANVRAA